MDFMALIQDICKEDTEGKAYISKSLARYKDSKETYNALLKINGEDAKNTRLQLLKRIGKHSHCEALEGFADLPIRAELIECDNVKMASCRINEIKSELWQPKRIDGYMKNGKVVAAVVIFERPYMFQVAEIVEDEPMEQPKEKRKPKQGKNKILETVDMNENVVFQRSIDGTMTVSKIDG